MILKYLYSSNLAISIWRHKFEIIPKTKFIVARINKCKTHGKHDHQYGWKSKSPNIICYIVDFSWDIGTFFIFSSQEFRPPFSVWDAKCIAIIWVWHVYYCNDPPPPPRDVSTIHCIGVLCTGHWPVNCRRSY